MTEVVSNGKRTSLVQTLAFFGNFSKSENSA